MLIVGIKVTHDGGVAVIDDDRLVASVEMEKRGNGSRYTDLGDLRNVPAVLADHEVKVQDVDQFVVDGWGYGDVSTALDGQPVRLRVAPYREPDLDHDSLLPYAFAGLQVGDVEAGYRSFHHTTGHIMSAYCASPFGQAGAPSFVLVWDGGVVPRAYSVRPEPPYVENHGPILGLMGNTYAVFAMHFDPFRMAEPFRKEADGDAEARNDYNRRRLSVPGKVMAYTALGRVSEDLHADFERIYDAIDPTPAEPRPHRDENPIIRELIRQAVEVARSTGLESADVLATFQAWLGSRVVTGLRDLRERLPGRPGNLCFAGGCALNIKWNSAIRRSGVFDRVWVPPFPNDSGAALGAACAGMVTATGRTALDWSVYAGPALTDAAEVDGYRRRDCDVDGLARLLHETGEPVVVLQGRAELGPRALGNRSIIAPPTDPRMKDRLNEIKRREPYRPVSPICLEDRAPAIFDPGTPDPYMLFDHQTRAEWRSRIPAVVHLDDSARLQTVNADQNPVMAGLLAAYEAVSGVPVLCNTSANFEGRGFFPDVASALYWGRTRYVWSEGVLWERDEPPA